jgi:succinoglycan biosynthesis protein ExoA
MPLVSVIIPCRNEEKTVSDLLEGLLQQTFPTDQTEILFSDGMSTDLTRQKITDFQLHHPECSIRILENSHQTIPAALNLAIANARGEYIVRLDAHSLPDPHYLEYCIRDLQAGKAENVGGVWQVKPGADTWIARSIAQAGSHPLGVGDARYRFATKADYVETVPFGAYNKELIDRIGGYDETLHANEDYEFNTRITKSGGKIWMNPEIQVDYFARSTFTALAKQYWNYGFWKAVMLQRYPETVRYRQALPPLFVACLAGLLILSLIHPFFLHLLGIMILIYVGILAATSVRIAYQKRYLAFIIGIPIAVCIMHICWGSGFIWSRLKLALKHQGVPQKSE